MIVPHKFSATRVGKLNYSQVTMQYMYYYKSVCVFVWGGGERETETERERQREREPKYADRNEELFALTTTASALT